MKKRSFATVWGEGHLIFNLFALIVVVVYSLWLNQIIPVAAVVVIVNIIISLVAIARRFTVVSTLLERERQAVEETSITGSYPVYNPESEKPHEKVVGE